MNTKQEIKDLIIKYKNHLNYDPLVNDLCRLYFEIESQDYKENPFEGSQVKETKDDVITEQSLLDLGFVKKTSIIFQKNSNFNIIITYNIQNKEITIYDIKENNTTIVLDRLFKKECELKNLLNSII
jgi:hypothetical protein